MPCKTAANAAQGAATSESRPRHANLLVLNHTSPRGSSARQLSCQVRAGQASQTIWPGRCGQLRRATLYSRLCPSGLTCATQSQGFAHAACHCCVRCCNPYTWYKMLQTSQYRWNTNVPPEVYLLQFGHHLLQPLGWVERLAAQRRDKSGRQVQKLGRQVQKHFSSSRAAAGVHALFVR